MPCSPARLATIDSTLKWLDLSDQRRCCRHVIRNARLMSLMRMRTGGWGGPHEPSGDPAMFRCVQCTVAVDHGPWFTGGNST